MSIIVQFSGSERNIGEDIRYYREIRRSIKNFGADLALDWIEDAYTTYTENRQNRSESKKDTRNWVSIHKASIDALKGADVCIYEATEKSFSIGFQTAMALQLKKPVLVLSRNNSLRNSFGSGIVSDLLTYKNYTEKTVSDVIKSFLEENNPSTHDLRFNFVIDKEINNYLRWASFQHNTTKAEIVRKLLRSKIEESNT